MGGELYGSGGLAKYVRELANYLVRCGYSVKILCGMGKIYTNTDRIINFHFQNLPVSHSRSGLSFYTLIQHLPNPLSVLFGVIRLIKDIRHEDNAPKVLHAQDPFSSLLIAFLVGNFF